VSPARCGNPIGPTQTGVDVPTPHQVSAAAAHGVAAAFDTYFGGINSGDYAAAYAVLSPQRQAAGSYAHFAAGDATSFDSDIHVLTASQPSPDVVMIGLQFTSLQRPDHAPNGRDSCDVWRLTYRMIRNPDNSWSIDATTAYEPSGDLYRSC
jgi:hypothetical protein